MDTPTGSGRSGRGHHHFGFSMWMAGGGVKPGITHGATDELGIDSDAKEAIVFAILAYESFLGRTANLPSATGASHPCILEKVYRPPVRGRKRQLLLERDRSCSVII